MSRIDFDQINRAALANLSAVLARVLLSGKQVHREWVALNPRRADRRLGSFRVNRYNGRWADFATGDKGGDPISLVAYLEGVSQAEAARRLGGMPVLMLGRARDDRASSFRQIRTADQARACECEHSTRAC